MEALPESAQADWTTWTVNHPAYRRAVPHHRSFLREAAFDSQLLVLTHEVTHVLSLIGNVGASLTALRVAALDAEISLWSLSGFEGEELTHRINSEGVAPLKDGETGLLLRAEQQLDLTLKTHILQDAWTPWFEGLAIFGEMAADPALDPIGIVEVTQSLRNLVDFHPPADADGVYSDAEAIQAAYEEMGAEFEARCSAAIRQRGPNRLDVYVRETRVPYFAGYTAVRGVVTAWREATGRALSGTEVFGLLLHATRFATQQAIPDLSLRSELFAAAAIALMCRWARGIARLSGAEIEDFVAPPARDGPGRLYRWDGYHPVLCSEEELARMVESDPLRDRVRQAFSSLSRDEDQHRVPDGNAFTTALCAMAAGLLRERGTDEDYVNIAEHLAVLGTLLPIGRAGARFFLNLDPEGPTPYLALTIRTTEAHVSDGSPSVNGLWLPIPSDAGRSIAASFRRLGIPRLEVSRVIDLAGILFPNEGVRGHHVLVFRYGDWLDVRGATQGVQILLDRDPEWKSRVTTVLRQRLYPETLERAERELMGSGRRAAERTRDWIDRSSSWTIDGHPVEAGPWVRHVRALAQRVLASGEERHARQFAAAHGLLLALFDQPALAHGVVHEGFEILTEHKAHSREHIVQALFRTAQRPERSDAIASAAAVVNSRVQLFVEGPHGWDIRSANRT
jgi:hypothetical protein